MAQALPSQPAKRPRMAAPRKAARARRAVGASAAALDGHAPSAPIVLGSSSSDGATGGGSGSSDDEDSSSEDGLPAGQVGRRPAEARVLASASLSGLLLKAGWRTARHRLHGQGQCALLCITIIIFMQSRLTVFSEGVRCGHQACSSRPRSRTGGQGIHFLL